VGVADPLPISLVVFAQDEEDRLADCLRSAEFCADRFVLDGGSRDSTVALAAALGARTAHRPFDGFVSQRTAAVAGALHDWVLCLDADERVSPALAAEIREAFAGGPPPHDGYDFPRLAHHLGRWIRHGSWYPDRKLRLFRRSRARCSGREPHDRIEVLGSVGHLRGDLLHHPYRDLADHLRRMDRYTTVAAERLHAEGRGWAAPQWLLRPPLAFIRAYVLRAGFLDGAAGLRLAQLEARYQRLRFGKLLRLRREARGAGA
jgi:glycosyltransferase involved in cell wall biosynthesis